MNKIKEKKFLEQTIKEIENDKQTILTTFWFSPLIWLISAIIFNIIILAFEKEIINVFVVITLSALIGCVIGFIIFAQTALKDFPYIKKYINKDKIKKRIEELNNAITK
ncbi:MAG: hypothetical protein OEZ31_11675 [Nitrospirota bacterium]|nr:hypothetical protein [Nitrospirota bacterium]